MKIRTFEMKDYEEICRWSKQAFYGAETALDQIPETSFVCEKNNTLIAFISVILTNCKAYCITENLLSNPDSPKGDVKKAVELLCQYVQRFSKALQYKGLFCLAPNKVLARRYKQLGFAVTLSDVTTMRMEI